MWQYTDSGSPSGTTGKVDLDAYAKAPDVLVSEWSGVPGTAGAIPIAANEQLQGGANAAG
jgi:GH25 family lysozyme M1 (1,4-beta-N-acetylmuramidase)